MKVPISLMRYDHTMPLFEGRVEIEGVELKPVRTSSMVFGDVVELREGNFGLWDLELGAVLPAIEAGWELVGLPVFAKRKPMYTYLWCRADRGIDSPEDIQGKRIGTGFYPTCITIWLQGLLQHRHGVNISLLQWVVPSPRRVGFPLHVSKPIVETAQDKKSPMDRLFDGEVDAMIMDISDGKAFERLERSPEVKRLFPDYIGEDKTLYRETGVYTPVHQIVMSKKLDRENPGLARKIYAAFESAKSMAYESILNDRAGFSVVYLRERLVEQQREWGDPWKYGVSANKTTIDCYIRYNVDQGITSRPISPEEWFAESTLDT